MDGLKTRAQYNIRRYMQWVRETFVQSKMVWNNKNRTKSKLEIEKLQV